LQESRECFLVCHRRLLRRNTEVIVLRIERLGVTMTSIADMSIGMTGTGLKDDGGNVRKEDGCGVKKKDVVVGMISIGIGMTGIEDIRKSSRYVSPDA
jgi:hypothetical protein